MSKNVYEGENAFKKAKGVLNGVLNERNLIINKGQIEKQPDPAEQAEADGIDVKKLVERAEQELKKKRSPIDPVVTKLAQKGLDADSSFVKLDDNGDGVLTIKEIKDGFAQYDIGLTLEEWGQFHAVIDANSDGVLTLEEWRNVLAPRVSAESAYQKIMGNVQIDDPLSLEERCLDFQYRNRKLESELKILKKQAGPKGKNGQTEEIKKLSKQIISAEQNDEETKQLRAKSERDMEEKLRAQMLDR